MKLKLYHWHYSSSVAVTFAPLWIITITHHCEESHHHGQQDSYLQSGYDMRRLLWCCHKNTIQSWRCKRGHATRICQSNKFSIMFHWLLWIVMRASKIPLFYCRCDECRCKCRNKICDCNLPRVCWWQQAPGSIEEMVSIKWEGCWARCCLAFDG